MSIHAQISEEAKAALAAQKRNSSISSIIIAVLSCFLLGLILFVIALTVEVKSPPEIISYANVTETEVVEKPEVTEQVVKPPSAPNVSMAKVIAGGASNISVPVPTVDVAEANIEFSTNEDFSDDFSDMSWTESAAAAASFFGQQVKAERIAYVIDYSKSMSSQGRVDIMKKELDRAIKELPAGIDYQMIFFAGPAWFSSHEVKMAGDRKTAVITNDETKEEYKWKGSTANNWQTVGGTPKVPWMKSTATNLRRSRSIARDTQLVWGTAWKEPLEMALAMDPKPDVIFFMTDGSSGRDSLEIAETIGRKARGMKVKINSIAMMVPSAKEAMATLAEKSGGQFSIVDEKGETEVVIEAK